MKSLLTVFLLTVSLVCFSQEVKVQEATLFIESVNNNKSELKWTESGYIYDQPVTTDFIINSLDEDVFKLIVFNSYGEKIMFQEDLDSSIAVDASTLVRGTYYVVLRGDKYKKSFKFTKV